MEPDRSKTLLAWVLRMAIFLIVSSALLFLIAGDWRWTSGWIFVALQVVNVALSYFLLYAHKPDLLARRSGMGEGTPKWDKVLAPLMAYSTLIISIVLAVGYRFAGGWRRPWWLLGLALLLATAGHMLTIQSMRQNTFFEATVRLQAEHDHKVVNTGPYRVVRHPGYVGMMFYNLAVPVILGSLWGFVGVGFFLVVLFWRTAREDRFLRENLEGYAAYAERTRWRLFPEVW